MPIEILLDAGSILGGVQETPWGFIKVPARLGAEGVVTYTLPNGTKRREYRPKEEILKLDSLQSYQNAPLTGRHPYDEPTQLLLPENIKKHFAGMVCDTVKGGEVDGVAVVDGFVMIMDAADIQAAREGKLALSPGYLRRLEMTPGVWKNPKTGEAMAYDAIQRDIRVNHVAMCDQGRQGPLVRLMMDSLEGEKYEYVVNLDALEIEKVEKKKPQGGRSMKKIKIGGAEFEVADEVAARLDALESEATTAKATVATLTDEKKTALDSAASAQGKADAALAEVKTLKEAKPNMDSIPVADRHAAAERRMRVIAVAKAVLPKDQHKGLTALDETEIMKKVVVVDSPDTPEDKLKMVPYVEARFDSILESRKKAGKEDLTIALLLDESRETNQDADCTPEAKKAARLKAVMDASKAPLTFGVSKK
jgi:hypothetical protein